MRVDAGQTFNFFPIPTDIHFGFGIRRSLPERLKQVGARRAFLVTDPGLRTAGILDELIAILSEGAIEATACDRVKPDSGSELIDLAAKELKDCGADVVIGVGGGSSLDTAKAVAALATNPGSCLDYVGLHNVRNRPLLMIAIPTTAGT